MRAVWRDPYNGNTPVKVTDIAGEKGGQPYYIVDGVKGPVPGEKLTFVEEEPATAPGAKPVPENRLTNRRPRSNLDVQGGADGGEPGRGNPRQPKGDKPRGNNFGDDEQEFIDDIEIIEGKVGGKIPVDEFRAYRQSSIKNPNADSMTLGKFTNGSDSYIAKAGKSSSYFDMGDEWTKIQNEYNLSDSEMFEYFNRPALDDAITSGKSFRFSHDPRQTKGFLGNEWSYIKNKLGITDDSLMETGGMWYVK